MSHPTRKMKKTQILLVLGISAATIFAFRVGIDTVLSIACDQQNSGLIKAAIRLGANTEYREEGRTLLIFAVEANEIRTAQALLEAGADPNGADPNGAYLNDSVTPLEIAEGENFDQLAKLLLKYGAVRK